MIMTAHGPAHQRLWQDVVIMVLVVIAAVWSPPAASAGGPTSVLITDPATHRNAAAHVDDARYRQLAAAIGMDPARGAELPSSGWPAPSGYGELFRSDLRITWLAHDTVIWRIELIFFIQDEVWVATGPAWISEPDQAVWHPAADPGLLRSALAEAGLLRGSATEWPSWAPSPAPAVRADAAASGSVITVLGFGIVGLGLGVGGTLLLRRRGRA